MGVSETQIALCVLEGLRNDPTYARLKNGRRILDVADLRQYIYELMCRIRTDAHFTETVYGNSHGHGQDITTNNGHQGRVDP
jgi:urease gamma subunit